MILYSNEKNMNKNTKKRYQEISKPILSGAVFVASFGLIGAGALAASSSLYNLKAANPANNNQLTAENRDTLITEVENLKSQIGSNNSIPAGAVMAFNLSSCPDGWSPFTEANDRFIMGSQWNLKEKGGTGKIELTINQLPSHYFYIA